MRFSNKTFLTGIIAMSVFFVCIDADAGDPLRKLGRGVVNAAFGVLEILVQVYDVNKEEGGLAAITYGPVKGIGYCVAREVIGVVEIATFLIPLPGAVEATQEAGWGYGPLMEPEWIIGPEHDIFNVIYQDHPVD